MSTVVKDDLCCLPSSEQWRNDRCMRSVRKTVPADTLCDIYIKHKNSKFKKNLMGTIIVVFYLSCNLIWMKFWSLLLNKLFC